MKRREHVREYARVNGKSCRLERVSEYERERDPSLPRPGGRSVGGCAMEDFCATGVVTVSYDIKCLPLPRTFDGMVRRYVAIMLRDYIVENVL